MVAPLARKARRLASALVAVAASTSMLGAATPARAGSCSWQVMPSILTDGGRFSSVAALSPTDVWAVGQFSVNGTTRLAAHFDGTSWRVTPTPADARGSATLYAVAGVPGTNRAWAVGSADSGRPSQEPDPVAMRWTGSRWRLTPTPPLSIGGTFLGVTSITPGDVWAVGVSDASIGSQPRTLVEHWDRSGWSIVPTPPLAGFEDQVLSSVSGIAPGDVWAVGSAYENESTPAQALTEHWNGSAWHRVANPRFGTGTSGYLIDVSAASRDDVWATGGSLVLHWNGSSWSKSQNPRVTTGFLLGIDSLPSGSTWAVGYTTGTTTQGVIEHWNGSRWNATTGPPGRFPQLFDVSAISGHDVWAVGSDDFHPLVERREC